MIQLYFEICSISESKEVAMLKKNPIQFSVVREDPIVEISLIRQFKIIKPILIGSGGCTAFALASEFQKMPIALIEPNPAQVKLIKDKIKILETSNRLQIGEKVRCRSIT